MNGHRDSQAANMAEIRFNCHASNCIPDNLYHATNGFTSQRLEKYILQHVCCSFVRQKSCRMNRERSRTVIVITTAKKHKLNRSWKQKLTGPQNASNALKLYLMQGFSIEL